MNLPSAEQDKDARRAIRDCDVTDGYREAYEDLEYQRSDQHLPGIVEIVELDRPQNNEDYLLGDGDANDPDYDPGELNSSARSRGNVVRKRKGDKEKEKRPRSKSRGRRTRSQAAKEKEIMVD